MVKYYTLFGQGFDPDTSNGYVYEYTEESILDEYWDFWSKRMIEKFGVGHGAITPENCINEWIVVNWGWTDNDN